MTRHLIVAPCARSDLADIISYIELRNEAAAQRVLVNFKQEFWKLMHTPTLGHARPDVPDTRLRFWRVYSYMIAYRFDETRVEIQRIIHGHRDFTTIFGDAGKE